MDRKIDIVYLWVDSNDAKWRAEKDKWAAIESGKVYVPAESMAAHRWRDNDELKYSLRSVEKFAPWINHIYIVTCRGQTPEWLDTKNPKVTIVDHKEIMPTDALPNYNSMAIAQCAWNIPDLSEYFLLANDDTMFANYTSPEYFFDADDRPVMWYVKESKKRSFKKIARMKKAEYRQTLYYTARIFETVFGINLMHIRPPHNIVPYRKSLRKEALQNPLINFYFQNTIRNRFRNTYSMSGWIFSLYNYAFGKCVPKRMGTPKPWYRIIHNVVNFLNGNFKNSPYYTTNAIRDKIARRKPYLVCINDTGDNTDRDTIDNKKFMTEYYSEKSSFEK